MSHPLFLSYFAEEGGRRWGLSIHLDGASTTDAPSVWLRELHNAADLWRAAHPDVFLRSDLGVEAEPGFRRQNLPSYLDGSGRINGFRLSRHLAMLRETGRIHRFTISPGGVVEGPDLVGRSAAVEQLLAILETGSCHLRAPRRYGKTSLLRHLTTVLTGQGRPCVFVDVADSQDVPSFLLLTARAAVESPLCKERLAKLPELARWPAPDAGLLERSHASRILQETIGQNPWSFGSRLLSGLGDLGAVLLIDELSVFLRSASERIPAEAGQLMDLLARARRSSSPLRQVFAGSAGLSSYLHFHGLGPAIDDLKPLDLLPLARTDAAVLAEELLYGENLAPSPAAVDRMLHVLGEPIPYFVHALAGAIVDESQDDTVSPETVDRAYSRRILGDRGSHLFRIYRIGDQSYPRPLLRASEILLREMARSPEGAAASDLLTIVEKRTPGEAAGSFEPLLACLQEDFDLVFEEGRWRMRCKVLRDRWALRERWLTEVG